MCWQWLFADIFDILFLKHFAFEQEAVRQCVPHKRSYPCTIEEQNASLSKRTISLYLQRVHLERRYPQDYTVAQHKDRSDTWSTCCWYFYPGNSGNVFLQDFWSYRLHGVRKLQYITQYGGCMCFRAVGTHLLDCPWGPQFVASCSFLRQNWNIINVRASYLCVWMLTLKFVIVGEIQLCNLGWSVILMLAQSV